MRWVLVILTVGMTLAGCKRAPVTPPVPPTVADASKLAQVVASRLMGGTGTTPMPAREGLPPVTIDKKVSAWPVAADVEKSDRSIAFPVTMVFRLKVSEQSTIHTTVEGKALPDQVTIENAIINARVARMADGRLICVEAERRVGKSDKPSLDDELHDATRQIQSILDTLIR